MYAIKIIDKATLQKTRSKQKVPKPLSSSCLKLESIKHYIINILSNSIVYSKIVKMSTLSWNSAITTLSAKWLKKEKN
jgi:hypothetical protein